MLNFKKPEIEDIEWVRRLASKSEAMGCEFTFGNIFMWSGIYHTKIAGYKDFLLSQTCRFGKCEYCCPAGEGDLREIVDLLKEHAEENGHKLELFGVTESKKTKLSEIYGDKINIYPARETYDYIYETKELAELNGKKYHSKRNHIAFFESNFDWSFERIDQGNIAECVEMNYLWECENRKKDPKGIDEELDAIKKSFENYEKIGFKGALLRVDGKVIAYTFGEALNDQVFCTHVEKAFSDIRGAYPMINREFAKLLYEKNYRYVNREEDDGIEGLRKAKLSYYPAILLEKYYAEFN